MAPTPSTRARHYGIVAALAALTALVAVTVFALRVEGRRWWCACGQLLPWAGNAWSSHNSQHLFDPYSFTHVLHGLAFFGLLAWAWPRLAAPIRFTLAVSAEALWEIAENSSIVIERYRTATSSLNYTGDTVANSLGDIMACSLGFLLAGRLGLRGSVAVWLAIEVALLLWIRDNLFLSVLMLVFPLNAIKVWQLGG